MTKCHQAELMEEIQDREVWVEKRYLEPQQCQSYAQRMGLWP